MVIIEGFYIYKLNPFNKLIYFINEIIDVFPSLIGKNKGKNNKTY